MQKLFVIGCPRSGTTMVQQALNRHSRIVIPPETKYFFSFLGHCKRSQLAHLKRINTDLQIDLPLLSRRIRSVQEGRAFYDEMARRYVERLGRAEVCFFGDKTPEHTGYVPRIRRFFPGAKLVFIYRDGRDVALSMTKVPWMDRDLYVCFMVWLHYYRVLARLQAENARDVHFVRYEDLVVDPAVELRKVLDFLALGYEQACADGYGNREGIPEREYPWKARALEPIVSDRVGIWESELSQEQIRALERLGGNALQSLGYELTTDGAGRLPLAFVTMLSWRMLTFSLRLPWQSVVNEFVNYPFGSGRKKFYPASQMSE